MASSLERALFALYQHHPKSNATLAARSAATVPAAIFPALRQVCCTMGRPTVATLALLALLGSRVTRIDITRTVINIIKRPPLPPSLCSMDPQNLFASVFPCTLLNLRTTLVTLNLTALELTVEHVHAIATLPRLRTLAICCLSGWKLDNRNQNHNRLTRAVNHFPNLRELTFCAPHGAGSAAEGGLSACTAFLATFRPRMLMKLSTDDGVAVGSADELRAFFAMIVELKLTGLTELHCDMSVRDMQLPDGAKVKFDVFEPLFQLTGRHLKVLNLFFSSDEKGLIWDEGGRTTVDPYSHRRTPAPSPPPQKFEISDTFFERVARSWPQLEEFSLCTGRVAKSDMKGLPTGAALAALAKHPKLKRIGLTFDSSRSCHNPPRSDSVFITEPPRTKSTSKVDTLFVEHSPFGSDDVEEFTEWLGDVFPALEPGGVDVHADSRHVESWQELDQHMNLCNMFAKWAEPVDEEQPWDWVDEVYGVGAFREEPRWW